MNTTPKVLIVYTGGTIGMIKDAVTGQLRSFDFDHLIDHVPELGRLNIHMDTISFEVPIDSSEMNPEHWRQLGETIYSNYENYDGFVILHGSDTMAYTASALSFMFDGLQKPIIITGSQLPIGIIRTDGKENLITAIEVAACQEDGIPLIQEVAIYFEYHLYRGNRSTKDSATHFEAFRSPNYQELATAGVEIQYNRDKLFRSEQKELTIRTDFNDRVAIIKLFPGIQFASYEGVFDRSKVDGIILETYGAGNAPSDELLLNYCRQFTEQGGLIMNITQCSSGSVKQGLYETSAGLQSLGVISGGDMTTEAAITKMMVVLSQDRPEDGRELLESNIRGEMTV